MWTFLASSKSPPINLAQRVLRKFESKHSHRTVRIDQGKELGKSSLSQKISDS